MTANESKILRFFKGEEKSFAIPVYQRMYSWKKENCVQLLKDLTSVYNSGLPHFFGSVVFVPQNHGTAVENMIIDGQQRITTISLLLIAIRDYVLKHTEIDISIDSDEITRDYLTVLTPNDDQKVKLNLVKGDDEAYENLLDEREPIENTNITVNYRYFFNELYKMDKEKVEGLYDAISKLDIVGICLDPDNGDDPQSIFESLNSTGQDLETVDKIRNFVMMRMDRDKQRIFYKNYWQPFEKSCNKKDINDFIRYYLAVKDRKLYREDNVYSAFKNYRTQSEITEDDLLADMLEYAEYFNAVVCHSESVNSAFKEVFSRINRLEIKAYVPFTMDVLKANSEGLITDEEVIQVLEIVENYLVRREICDLGTHSLNRIFVQFISEIDKDMEDGSISYFEAFKHQIMKKTGKSRFPNNHDFEDKFSTYDLYNAKRHMKQYILERLENYNNKEIVDVESMITNQKLTTEHVMPQSLNLEWKEDLGENWELIYSKYLHTPGNLTLIAYNSELGNSPFLDKRDMEKIGYKASKLSLNDFIVHCDAWGEKEILERAKVLYGKAEKIWWIPDDPIERIEEAEWHNWDEEFEVTDCKIPQIIIMDKIIDTKDMTEAYEKINEVLYDCEPIIYQESALSWFGRSADDLKGNPYQIGENAYIETHRSSLEKLNYIKAIAELFDLSPEDIRFLVQLKTK